jgi:hypothetical protein
VVQDIAAALDTIEDYVEDWRAVLARSAEHCRSCGKCLTDAISRSRGVENWTPWVTDSPGPIFVLR